jgi:flagellar basal-body rod protein FlgF
MRLQERRLAVIANNPANKTPAGYKAMQVSFEMPKSPEPEAQSGNVAMSSMASFPDLTNASFLETGAPLDLAIEGKGFFVIETAQGTLYTRNGRFAVDADKKLVTVSGGRVIGDHGTISVEGSDVAVRPNGSVHVNGQPHA